MSNRARAINALCKLFGDNYFVQNKERLLKDFAAYMGDPSIAKPSMDDLFQEVNLR